MTNEVRKPRVFWIYWFGEDCVPDISSVRRTRSDDVLEGFYDYYNPWKNVWEPATEICVREILPGDDSIRVSRKDWETIKQIMVPSAISVSRKLTDPYGIIERIEREQDIK